MNWLRNFMIGRYGTDSLSLFLLVLSVIITFVSSIFGGNIITLLLSYGLWFWIISVGEARWIWGVRRAVVWWRGFMVRKWGWGRDEFRFFRRFGKRPVL